MEQLERIQYHEETLNEAREIITVLNDNLERYLEIRDKLTELLTYYGSQEWFKDFEDDEQGLLPADLRRGVLSEDAVYDLLEDNRDMITMMADVIKYTAGIKL